jgi:hypothetical protein
MTRVRRRSRATAAVAATLVAGCFAIVAATQLGSPDKAGSARPARARTTADRPRPEVRRNCAAKPSACGFPDPTNTGVPSGTPLTPSGAINVTTPGTVISKVDVQGTITISADNVRIVDSRVTASSPQGAAVFIAAKVRGTVIEDTTIRGQDAGPHAVAYAILNAGWPPNATTVVRRAQMSNCRACFNGPGTLEDSYAIVSAVAAGAHYEDVYYGGGAGLLAVRHDTLLNPQPQTAVVFTKPDYGTVKNVIVSNSLLAGGGWTIYGGGTGATEIVVENNRFSPLYHARVGSAGVATGFNWSQTTWAGNVSDATLETLHG